MLQTNSRVAGLQCNGIPLCRAAYTAGKSDAAAAAGQQRGLRIVTQLLTDGADVNERDKDGHTALMMASMWGHVPIAAALLDAGADPSLKLTDSVWPNTH